jgi:chromosome segregation ATPase
MARTSSFPQRQSAPPPGLPTVRVEVQNGSGRPAIYDLTGEEFLIGSVPGCDLRLPGTNLPPVVCLIARQTDGIRLRKLAPTLPVLVNGQPISQTAATALTHGDCISIGAVDLLISIDFSIGVAPTLTPISTVPTIREEARITERDALDRRERDLRERERQHEDQTRELEADRILWYRRRDEMEQELRHARDDAARHERLQSDLDAREGRVRAREDELERRQTDLRQQQDDLLKLRDETLATRRELNERFTGRRNELSQVQDTIRETLESIQQREANLETEFAARRDAFEVELRQKREQADADLKLWHNQGASGLTHLRDQVEKEIAAKHKQRADELDRFQLNLREAAIQLRERKQTFDDEVSKYEPRHRELLEREQALQRKNEELEHRETDLKRELDLWEIDRRAKNDPLADRERDLAECEAELERQKNLVETDRETIAKGKAQHEADLIRLDRWQAQLDEKEKHLRDKALEIDQRHERFEHDGRDLEHQVVQIDAREEQSRAEDERQAKLRAELDEREAKLNERLAQVEGQQAMLAALRTRLEHLREEQRTEAARIAEERARLEEHARESQEKLRDAERLRQQLAGEQVGQSDAERIFRERSELLAQAVQRLRDLQQQMRDEDERLRNLDADLAAKAADLAERDGFLQGKSDQLLEAQQRLDVDRQALKQREESIFLTEGTRESLQDQLRRRAEELMTRGQELDRRALEIEEHARQVGDQREALEKMRSDTSGYDLQMQEQAVELSRREEELNRQAELLKAAEFAVAEQRKQFDEARLGWEQQQREAEAKAAQAREEVEALKQTLAQQATELLGKVPDMESRAQSALDRTAQAREALRGQLAELHTYTRQSQEDLDKVRLQVQDEIERMRQQESTLTRARAEHRHAVASFRQQLIEWQARFSEMKQALSRGESRIERREKDIEATSQQLAEQAKVIEVRQREVAEKRTEMERHLNDMRDWYRKKLRELVASRGQGSNVRGQGSGVRGQEDEPAIIKLPDTEHSSADGQRTTDDGQRTILSIRDDLEPADRKLGDLLRSLELVDAETISALWIEARRQRRPLRQVLLAGGYLTLYQLALIETGNLSGLVLGRFRVIDKLPSTPREAIYRVFDPQGERGNCVLRHLGEMEMHDAVRPDEYRQRFSAARDLAHPNIAATLEVLDINGRPAVVQEWLNGLPGDEFPATVGVPGVWFRLLSQAALGLHTAHQAGLIHGRLTPESLLLTPEGMLKITGLGEPTWLHPSGLPAEPSAEDDLRSLGRIVLDWSTMAPKKRGKKGGLPDGLLGVLRGLGAETNEGIPLALYPRMATLLEDLDHIGSEVPDEGGAWQKLLEHVGENATESPTLRQTA